MTQTLVERVTGLTYADEVDVEINLVLDAKTLLDDGTTPVQLEGYGPICPEVADELIAKAHTASVRRLLVNPVDGTLLVREPRRRRYDRRTTAHIRTRDRRCRQPGNGAIAQKRIAAMEDSKIRDIDHPHDYQHGGTTTKDNAQGLCERSHQIKHQPGWTVTVEGNTTIWRTPTGHQYRSDPPPVLPKDDPDPDPGPGHRRQ
jgi:hypothetical protein